jgi:hypothetical protein
LRIDYQPVIDTSLLVSYRCQPSYTASLVHPSLDACCLLVRSCLILWSLSFTCHGLMHLDSGVNAMDLQHEGLL